MQAVWRKPHSSKTKTSTPIRARRPCLIPGIGIITVRASQRPTRMATLTPHRRKGCFHPNAHVEPKRSDPAMSIARRVSRQRWEKPDDDRLGGETRPVRHRFQFWSPAAVAMAPCVIDWMPVIPVSAGLSVHCECLPPAQRHQGRRQTIDVSALLLSRKRRGGDSNPRNRFPSLTV